MPGGCPGGMLKLRFDWYIIVIFSSILITRCNGFYFAMFCQVSSILKSFTDIFTQKNFHMSQMDMVCDKFHFKNHVDAWCNKHCIPCTHVQIWRYLCLLIHTIKQQHISMSGNNTIQYRAPRLLVTKFLFKAFREVFKNKPH